MVDWEKIGEGCPKRTKAVLRKYKNDFNPEFIKMLDVLCTDDRLYDYFDPIPDDEEEHDNNVDLLQNLENDWDEVEEEINNTKNGNPIYRGLIVDDYKSFKNGLTHHGETLDRWIGKEPKKHPDAGRYWTWNENCARVEGQCGHEWDEKLVILKGINPNIDAIQTHYANFLFENAEKEITLEKGSEILVEEICRHEKKIIKGKEDIIEICEPFNKRVIV